MTFRPARMQFGAFLAPFHRMGENPTLALRRDLKLLESLDELGYDEAWIGEHHSWSREIIGDPVAFIAAAAQRTRRIKLGTGVLSLPYHHPLIVADQMVFLDHLTEGRTMFGVGPGALASDAYMMGIEPAVQRPRMLEALDAIMHLLRSREPLTVETDWFALRDARLQLANYTTPHLPVSVAATFTPSGPRAAGRFGLGLLSVAGVEDVNFDNTWTWAQESAEEHGQQVSRANWRVAMPVHLAESREQAFADLRYGFARRAYIGDRGTPGKGGSPFTVNADSVEEAADRRVAIFGTPDDAIAIIDWVAERSGGFGGLLHICHEWANTEATNRSYELFARYVAPHYQGQLEALRANRDWVEEHQRLVFGPTVPALKAAFAEAGVALEPGPKPAS